ncbi:MAG TPA: D-alanyl-D-alanine carboxypeptidase family protein [Symbiobacteriaceae bacterium]|nr:D-alanyl-D-alanine carboxypeptidase family protein [Symbiobacteriaceae bacterium]
MYKRITTVLFMTAALILAAGCSEQTGRPAITPAVTGPAPTVPVTSPAPTTPAPVQTTPAPAPAPVETKPAPSVPKPEAPLASNHTSITVLVNKRFRLPADYRPADLVVPNVPFIFKEADDKRLMRKEAAQALETLFAAAKQAGIHLAGVSGFRSYETQQALYSYYVKVQGEETASRYSAQPGHSEHQTGLAMDVSGSTGKCAADDCFADTPEADWLAKHAHEYGFIIRYPKGKESITGYAYEPWHLRYVGTALSKQVAAAGVTLEEQFGQVR